MSYSLYLLFCQLFFIIYLFYLKSVEFLCTQSSSISLYSVDRVFSIALFVHPFTV